jgi:hypothetical protein
MAVCEGVQMQQPESCCDEIIKLLSERYKFINMLKDYAAK